MNGTYISKADIFNQSGVEVGLCDDLLQELDDNAVERSILEAALPCLCERCSDGEGDDNVIRVLGGASMLISIYSK